MERNRRKYQICFIDCMWYAAEKWSAREHNNLNGGMLLFLVWAFAILLPLGEPTAFHFLSRIAALTIMLALCLVPGLFCKFRYTVGRCEALQERYHDMKHPGQILCRIVLAAIALTVANVALMFHFGFIHWSR